MNRNLQIILSACENPIILAPDSLPVINGNIFAICTNIDNQGNSYPIIISTQESVTSVSNITDVTPNSGAISKRKLPILGVEQLRTSVNAKMQTSSNVSKLSCKVCDKRFTRLENLMFHEQTHNNSNLFHCNTCSKSFSKSQSLIDHLTSHQVKKANVSDETSEKCEICGKYFHKSCITKHEEKYKSQVMFYCRFCEQSFSKRGLLIYHLKLHSDEDQTEEQKKQEINKCEICLETFSQSAAKTLSDLKKRIGNSESLKLEAPPVLKKEPFQSKRRKRSRTSNRLHKMPILEPEVQNTNVNLTKLDVNQGIKRTTEENKRTDSQDNCTNEAIIISDDENDTSLTISNQQSLIFRSFLSCEICLNTFLSNKELLDHCNEHLELQCIDCAQYFNSIHDLLQHEERLHRIQCYTCKKCNKNITLKSNFIEHILSHPTKSLHVCKVCYLYLFQNYTEGVAQFKLYIGKKVFQCDICCKILQTVNMENLQCNLCPALFKSKLFLKDHQERYSLTNIKCIECDKYFHSVKGFSLHKAETKNDCVISHKRHIFTNKSDFNCIKCFMEFLSPEDLQDHCFDMEHYKCSNCEEKFSDWESFSSHLVLYPLILCTGCKLFVLGEHSLKKHKKLCSQVLSASVQSLMNFDNNKNLLCTVCKDTFSKKECLVEHIIFLH